MATLDEPYLVTSYGINPDQAGPSKAGNERFKLGVTSVNYWEPKASKAGKQQSRRAIAVNTVQGNGIHLVDVSSSQPNLLNATWNALLTLYEILDCSSTTQLSDQSPLSAFTVSPATIFTCKAVSVSYETSASSSQAVVAAASTSAAPPKAGRVRSRKTFVGLQQNGEYQLCCWTEVEDVDGTAVGDAVKVTKMVRLQSRDFHPLVTIQLTCLLYATAGLASHHCCRIFREWGRCNRHQWHPYDIQS